MCVCVCVSRARPQFAVWAAIHLLRKGGEILVADARGGGREHYKFPIDDHWFNIKSEYMEQKGLSLWTLDSNIDAMTKEAKEHKFVEWLDSRNLE